MNKIALNGKYKAYPEYKESGRSLLDDIPIHWQLTKVKYVAEFTPIDTSIIGRFRRCVCAM